MLKYRPVFIIQKSYCTHFPVHMFRIFRQGFLQAHYINFQSVKIFNTIASALFQRFIKGKWMKLKKQKLQTKHIYC